MNKRREAIAEWFREVGALVLVFLGAERYIGGAETSLLSIGMLVVVGAGFSIVGIYLAGKGE